MAAECPHVVRRLDGDDLDYLYCSDCGAVLSKWVDAHGWVTVEDVEAAAAESAPELFASEPTS